MSFELQGSGTYEDIVLQAKALIEDEPELVPNMANLSALLNLTLKNINWVDVYKRQLFRRGRRVMRRAPLHFPRAAQGFFHGACVRHVTRHFTPPFSKNIL